MYGITTNTCQQQMCCTKLERFGESIIKKPCHTSRSVQAACDLQHCLTPFVSLHHKAQGYQQKCLDISRLRRNDSHVWLDQRPSASSCRAWPCATGPCPGDLPPGWRPLPMQLAAQPTQRGEKTVGKKVDCKKKHSMPLPIQPAALPAQRKQKRSRERQRSEGQDDLAP